MYKLSEADRESFGVRRDDVIDFGEELDKLVECMDESDLHMAADKSILEYMMEDISVHDSASGSDSSEMPVAGIGSPVPGDPQAPEVGATNNGPFMVRGFYEVEDGGGEIIPDARLTRYEIRTAAAYWHTLYQEGTDVSVFLGQPEWRRASYALGRLEALRPFLSEEFKEEIDREGEEREAEREAYRQGGRRRFEQ